MASCRERDKKTEELTMPLNDYKFRVQNHRARNPENVWNTHSIMYHSLCLQKGQDELKDEDETNILVLVNAGLVHQSRNVSASCSARRHVTISSNAQRHLVGLAMEVVGKTRWRWRTSNWKISAQETSDYGFAMLKLSDLIAFSNQLALWLWHCLVSLSCYKECI